MKFANKVLKILELKPLAKVHAILSCSQTKYYSLHKYQLPLLDTFVLALASQGCSQYLQLISDIKCLPSILLP